MKTIWRQLTQCLIVAVLAWSGATTAHSPHIAQAAVGAEQGKRYDAAACFLLLCAQGVPTTDPKYAALVTMQAAGGTYTAELNELRGLQAKEMFTYTPMDVVNDFLLRHDEAVRRSGGVLKVASGSLGMASGAGMATGAALDCGPSAGTSCLLVPVGAGLLMLSYEEAKAGTVQAAGSYSSTEGSRVLASFNVDSYPGERDRIKELGLDLATAGLLAATAKLGAGAVDKLGAKLEKWWADRAVKEVKGGLTAVDDLLAAANRPYNTSSEQSVLSRAWDKHSGRQDGTFEPLKGNAVEKNAASDAYLRDLLNNPNTIRTDLSRGGFEYRLPNGQGVRFNADGSFNTLLDPRKPRT